MTERDVVLTPLPQADGQVKNRPAIVLRGMPPHGDLLVCGGSTQLHQEGVGFDDVIRPIGSIGAERHRRLVGSRVGYWPGNPLPAIHAA
jgi:hypothetical protein